MLTLPNFMTVAEGKTEKLYYDARTSKDELCDLSGCEITVKSSDKRVVTATEGTVTGVAPGKAYLYFEVCRKDADGRVVYYDEHPLIVVVQ